MIDWFWPREPSDAATFRLFLLHQAGGSAANFTSWQGLFPADIAVQAIQLPGRYGRPAGPEFAGVDTLVAALRERLLDQLDDRPYALFGHSMGALIGYRLAVTMQRGGGPEPLLVALSGFGPGLDTAVLPPDDAPGDELMDRFAALGGLPDAVLTDPDLAAMVVPTLRADLVLCKSYRDDGARLRCPLAAYSGREDLLVGPERMAEWADRTDEFLGSMIFPGGHSYLDSEAAAVALDMGRRILRLRQTS